MLIATISIITTVVAIVMVAIGIIKEKYFPCVIYAVALLAIYTTTMPGVGAIGSDISSEIGTAVGVLNNGWNQNQFMPEITSLVVGFIAPLFARMFSIDMVTVFKFILPIIFALCPVLLYLIYSNQIEKKKAFIGAMFFIIMPVFALEIPTIGKSMVAEVFLALAFYALISKWNKWVKFSVMLTGLGLAFWCHYSIGVVGLAMFFVIALVLLVTKYFKKWKVWERRSTSPIMVLLVILIVSLLGFWYFSIAGSGVILKALGDVRLAYSNLYEYVESGRYKLTGNHQQRDIYQAPYVFTIAGTSSTNSTVVDTVSTNGTVAISPVTEALDIRNSYINWQDPLIRAAIGLDFFETTLSGKIFRIAQFITQFLIILGCIYILFRYKRYKFSTEFLGGMGACAGILLLCIIVPNLSSILNITRFYHLSLFFLALMLPVGVDAILGFCGVIWKKNQF